MRSGQLRHRVTLQELGTRIDDGAGGGSIPFNDVVTLQAAIEPLTGEERFQAGTLDPRLSHRVRTRYYPGVKPHWRVKYGTRVFDIQYPIDPEERHRELHLMCEELPPW